MALKVTGIDHINLIVKDLNKTCKFWEDLFGFETLEEIPEQSGRIIGNKNALLALYENPNMKKHDKASFSHVSFHVENFEEIEIKCKEMGLEIFYGGILKWEKSRSIYINDPNGYEIELSEIWGGGLVSK